MAKQNFGGLYANMDFPPYTYREYPKHVVTDLRTGAISVVQNEIEEKDLLHKLQKDEDDAPAVHIPYVADPEKQILISRARELGVPFNPKWSKSKLQALVYSAEQEVDNLPVEELPTKAAHASITDSALDPTGDMTQEEIKDELIAQAKSLGIPANKLWGIPRLKLSITEAQNR